MRPSRTAKTTAKTTATRSLSTIDAFKAAAAESKLQEPVKASMLYSIAFTTKFPPERIWNKLCSDGTVRLIGTVTQTSNISHQGKPISNDQLANLSVEIRVSPDLFENISDNIADMVGGGVSILFNVGEPIFSVLTTADGEVNNIVFYATSVEGMEVNTAAISGLGLNKDEMDNFLLAARSQNNDRQKRRQAERTSKLQAARASADAASGNAEWAAAPAESTNPMD